MHSEAIFLFSLGPFIAGLMRSLSSVVWGQFAPLGNVCDSGRYDDGKLHELQHCISTSRACREHGSYHRRILNLLSRSNVDPFENN